MTYSKMRFQACCSPPNGGAVNSSDGAAWNNELMPRIFRRDFAYERKSQRRSRSARPCLVLVGQGGLVLYTHTTMQASYGTYHAPWHPTRARLLPLATPELRLPTEAKHRSQRRNTTVGVWATLYMRKSPRVDLGRLQSPRGGGPAGVIGVHVTYGTKQAHKNNSCRFRPSRRVDHPFSTARLIASNVGAESSFCADNPGLVRSFVDSPCCGAPADPSPTHIDLRQCISQASYILWLRTYSLLKYDATVHNEQTFRQDTSQRPTTTSGMRRKCINSTWAVHAKILQQTKAHGVRLLPFCTSRGTTRERARQIL